MMLRKRYGYYAAHVNNSSGGAKGSGGISGENSDCFTALTTPPKRRRRRRTSSNDGSFSSCSSACGGGGGGNKGDSSRRPAAWLMTMLLVALFVTMTLVCFHRTQQQRANGGIIGGGGGSSPTIMNAARKRLSQVASAAFLHFNKRRSTSSSSTMMASASFVGEGSNHDMEKKTNANPVQAPRHLLRQPSDHHTTSGSLSLPPHKKKLTMPLSLHYESLEQLQATVYDVAVIGAGPAGLTAALFASRSGLRVLVLGSVEGMLSQTPRLENYPGYYSAAASAPVNKQGAAPPPRRSAQDTPGTGPNWLTLTRQQAASFGAKFAPPGLLVQQLKNQFELTTAAITTATDHALKARSVVIATGATPRRLNLKHETDLWSRSIHSCAICDGSMYIAKTVVIVGGGDAAVDAALMIAKYAQDVILVHRRNEFRAQSAASVELLHTTENIQIRTPYMVKEWLVEEDEDGLKQLRAVSLAKVEEDGATSETKEVKCDGAFLMIGSTPNTKWLESSAVKLDSEGLIELDSSGNNGKTATLLPGVFAAGEVMDSVYRQAITAAAEGAQAAMDAERWLRQQPKPHLRQAAAEKPQEKKTHHHGGSLSLGTIYAQDNKPNPEVVVPPKTAGTAPLNVVGTPPLKVAGSAPLAAAGSASLQVAPEQEEEKEEECDLTKADCLHSVVTKYPVVVFSKPWCPYCRKALEALRLLQANPLHVVDLSQQRDMRGIQDLLAKLTGRRTVPNVYINGKSIGGGDETVAALHNGSLKKWLQAAGALPSPDAAASAQ